MMRLSFKEMKDAIAKIVPKDIQYDVDLEAVQYIQSTLQVVQFQTLIVQPAQVLLTCTVS